MKTMKKWMGILLAVCMVFGSIHMTAVAADVSDTTDAITWTYDEETETLTISGTGAIPDYNYEGYDPYPDDLIAWGYTEEEIEQWLAENPNHANTHDTPWIAYKDVAKHIVIEEGITEIGKYAFDDFTVLEDVQIPDTVTKIAVLTEAASFPVNSELILKGTSLSYVEAYATANDYQFQATNEQLAGDINGSGKLDVDDALYILRMYVNLDTLYGFTADANQDGRVDVDDALYVLQVYVNLLPEM